MRDVRRRCVILVLLWALSPGLTEALENAWHLAVSGHVAHAPDQGDDHAPDGDEHGCSGTFHLCSCHHSTPTTLTPAPRGVELPGLDRDRGPAATPTRSLAPDELFRPPRA